MSKITNTIVPNRRQENGDITLPEIKLNVDWMQIDAECPVAPASGKLLIMFLTPGLTILKQFRDSNGNPLEIDLTAPYPVLIQSAAVESIVLRPVEFDSDKVFSVGVTYKLGGDE